MKAQLKWTWPKHNATGVVHTVDTPGGRCAGFLVRSTTSGADLGYVWPAGNAWMWRTPDGKNHGERSSQVAAVKVLRDAHDLRGRAPKLPFDGLEGKLADAELAPPLRSHDRPVVRNPGWLPAGRTTRPKPSSPRLKPPTLTPRTMPDDPPTPAAEPVVFQKIKWGVQAPDLTDAIAAAFAKRKP